jgi:hypothetical protein
LIQIVFDSGVLFAAGSGENILSLEDEEHKPNIQDDVWEKHDRTLYSESRAESDAIISIAFVKKYLLYAKSRITPTLGDAVYISVILSLSLSLSLSLFLSLSYTSNTTGYCCHH